MTTEYPKNNVTAISDNNSADVDFFNGVYCNGPFTPLTVIVYMVSVITGILGPIAIIWYERNCNNRYRTVLNQLFASLAWYILGFTALIYIPDGIRFVNGPFEESFCGIQVALKNVIWVGVLLTLDCIAILRYVFIFTFKNFAVICDDIMARIFNLSVLLIAVWAAFVKHVTPGKMPLVYYLCTGKDPNKDGKEGDFIHSTLKYNTGRIIVTLSLILHLLLMPRVLYYQLVTMKDQQPHQLGTIDNERENNQSIAEPRPQQNGTKPLKDHQNNKNILDMASQVTLLILLATNGVIILISENVEPKKINWEEFIYIPLFNQIYGPFLGYIMLFTILLTRNEMMRRSLWRKIKINSKNNPIRVEE